LDLIPQSHATVRAAKCPKTASARCEMAHGRGRPNLLVFANGGAANIVASNLSFAAEAQPVAILGNYSKETFE
jgi:hypothetical protein